MLFRVVLVLTAAVGAAIGAVVYPFLGLLCLVVLNFGRPQDDRPNIVALHIPMTMLCAVILGMLLRMRTTVPAVIAALRRMKIMLLLTGLISLSVVANYTEEAKNGLAEFLTLMLFCLITLALVSTEKRLSLYLSVLLVSGTYLINVVIRNPKHIVERVGGDQFVRVDMAGQTQFGNANYLALYMVILMFISLALVAAYSSAWARSALLALVGLAGYVFFLANSRGASFALAGGLLVMWLTSKRKLKGTLVGVVLLILFAALAPDAYWDRLQTVSNYQQDGSATGRIELWGVAMDLIPQHPLFGVGFMNFQRYAVNSPHQAYLQIASEVGLPALLVYVSLLVSGIYAALRARQLSSPDRNGDTYVYAASQGILCCVVAVTIHGFTTGLAHREVVHVFVCLAYTVRALAGGNSQAVPIKETTERPQSALETAPWADA